MSRDNGGPAFPHDKYMKHEVTGARDTYAHGGMSLRDWFAGQALAGICAGLCASTDDAPRAKSRLVFREAAEDAYTLADAMLAEREKTR